MFLLRDGSVSSGCCQEHQKTPPALIQAGSSGELAHGMFTCSPVDLELNRDFNGEDYEYEDEAKLVIFPDHFEIPLPNIEELPALVRESLLRRLCVCPCMWIGCALSGSPSPSFIFVLRSRSFDFIATNISFFKLSGNHWMRILYRWPCNFYLFACKKRSSDCLVFRIV